MFLLALFVIFALLAIPLHSYAQPLIILATLPFAFMGAVWGHLLMKGFGNVLGLSMPSIFGGVAASGVVINATLVLLHEVNRRLSAGRVHLRRLGQRHGDPRPPDPDYDRHHLWQDCCR